MNVHVVCRNPNEDRVLARLARYLAEGNGWSVGERPNASADLNYFSVYIDYAERFSDWHRTPVAAYFSHYEANTPFKAMFWNSAAQGVDLAVVTARQYGEQLLQTRPTLAVGWAHPPVDSAFIPLEPTRPFDRRQLRVGVSGYVPQRYGERKGAALAQRLASAAGYAIAASGQWPEPIVGAMLPFAELPRWYNDLDVLLCTGLVEGIPMPPLEALACGLPVVLPIGVGMLDELPHDVPGIARYQPGNYEHMLTALEVVRDLLAAGLVDRMALRECVSAFTPANWCADHARLFDNYNNRAGTAPTANIESDRHGERGVVYVAYGAPSRECAVSAIASWRTHMPDVPVALISDEPIGVEDIHLPYPDTDIGGRAAKTLIDELAPRHWQYILYLDVDTEVVAPVNFFYEQLDGGFDFVICKNPGKYHTARQMRRSDNEDECEYTFNKIGTDELIQLNGGVFAYQRNPRTKAFFAQWHNEWQRWGKRDQAALLRALFAQPLRYLVLGNEWNTITRYDPPERSAGILHRPMTARRWRGLVHERSDSPAAWQAVKEFERDSSRAKR